MKNLKKILFGFMLVLISFIGITACSNDVPEGDDLEVVISEDYSWLLGTWDCSTVYEVKGNIDAINKYIPEDKHKTITVTEENLEATKDELLQLIDYDELYDKINEKLDDVAGVNLKAPTNTAVISDDRSRVTIVRKYKATAMLVINVKATVTTVWNKL